MNSPENKTSFVLNEAEKTFRILYEPVHTSKHSVNIEQTLTAHIYSRIISNRNISEIIVNG